MFQINGIQPIKNGNNQVPIPIKSMTIQPGQIIAGKLLKLYPSGMAEVQVRDVKIYAQIQADLQEGNRYYFVASVGKEGQLMLTVLNNQEQQPSTSLPTLVDILKTLKLPETEQSKQLLQLFIDKGLPVSKENMTNFLTLLGNKVITEEAKKAIVTIVDKQLPITKETFQGIVAFQNGEGFAEPLLKLMNIIQKTQPELWKTVNESFPYLFRSTAPPPSPLSPLMEKVSSLLSTSKERELVATFTQPIIENIQQNIPELKSILKTESNPTLEMLIQSISNKEMGNGKIKNELLQTLFQFLYEVDDSPLPPQQKQQLAEMLTKNVNVSIMIENNPLVNSASHLQTILEHINTGTKQALPVTDIKTLLHEMNKQYVTKGSQALITQIVRNIQDKSAFIQYILRGDTTKDVVEFLDTIIKWNTSEEKQPLNSVIPSLLQLVDTMENSVISPVQKQHLFELLFKNTPPFLVDVMNDSSVDIEGIKENLKQGLNIVGLQHENSLLKEIHGSKENPNMENVKAILIKLQQEVTNVEGKNIIHHLLDKILGHQLVAKDIQGPLVFLTTMFPMYMENVLRDVVMQWSGRKKKDENIDADYCRVVFLLQLDHIGETLIIMNVQQRVITLSIYTGNKQVEQQGKIMEEQLKSQLSKMDYLLSIVKFLQPIPTAEGTTNLEKVIQMSPRYDGVDVKI